MNAGDSDLIEAVGQHIARHVAPVDAVFHEIVSDDLHIDVHMVKPVFFGRRYHTLVTSGMSQYAMDTGSDAHDFRYAELCILLDRRWRLTSEAFSDERWYWPVRLLKTLARYPREMNTWLGYGHSVASQDPPQPYAPGTELCAAVLLPPLSLGKAFFQMARADGATTHFWTVLPLYESELRFKMEHGLDALTEALDRAGIDDVIRHDRPHAI